MMQCSKYSIWGKGLKQTDDIEAYGMALMSPKIGFSNILHSDAWTIVLKDLQNMKK